MYIVICGNIYSLINNIFNSHPGSNKLHFTCAFTFNKKNSLRLDKVKLERFTNAKLVEHINKNMRERYSFSQTNHHPMFVYFHEEAHYDEHVYYVFNSLI